LSSIVHGIVGVLVGHVGRDWTRLVGD
jgi:hypothetical protein